MGNAGSGVPSVGSRRPPADPLGGAPDPPDHNEVVMSEAKKIINNPDDVVDEVLDGLVAVSQGLLTRSAGSRVVRRSELDQGKVGLVVGGGSGHEPMYGAYVGPGLADASVSGDIFAAPAPQHVQEAITAADTGAGVLLVYGNYAGDVMNFDMGGELAQDDDVNAATILVRDDVATEDIEGRRGIGGAFYVVKVAGAACARGMSLADAAAVTARAQDATRTLGVAVRAGTLPDTGALTFELGDDEIEIGLGVHGEMGVARSAMKIGRASCREGVWVGGGAGGEERGGGGADGRARVEGVVA